MGQRAGYTGYTGYTGTATDGCGFPGVSAAWWARGQASGSQVPHRPPPPPQSRPLPSPGQRRRRGNRTDVNVYRL